MVSAYLEFDSEKEVWLDDCGFAIDNLFFKTGGGVYMNEDAYVMTFYYVKEENILIDEDGYPVLDIYRYIPPKVWHLFLYLKDYYLIEVGPKFFIELIWPDDEEEEYGA